MHLDGFQRGTGAHTERIAQGFATRTAVRRGRAGAPALLRHGRERFVAGVVLGLQDSGLRRTAYSGTCGGEPAAGSRRVAV